MLFCIGCRCAAERLDNHMLSKVIPLIFPGPTPGTAHGDDNITDYSPRRASHPGTVCSHRPVFLALSALLSSLRKLPPWLQEVVLSPPSLMPTFALSSGG